MSIRNDSKGSKNIIAEQDIVISADANADGTGDIVFVTGGVERARVTSTGGGGIAGGWDAIYSLTADQSFATTSLADVTQLVAPVVASGLYGFQARLYLNSPDTNGMEVGVNGPAGATVNATLFGGTTTTAASGCNLAALNTVAVTAFCAIIGNGFLEINGVMSTVGAVAGNFSIQADKKTSGTGKVLKGSTLRFRRIY